MTSLPHTLVNHGVMVYYIYYIYYIVYYYYHYLDTGSELVAGVLS